MISWVAQLAQPIEHDLSLAELSQGHSQFQTFSDDSLGNLGTTHMGITMHFR